jgi:outer membrane receptor for ferrienterochelin and colicin
MAGSPALLTLRAFRRGLTPLPVEEIELHTPYINEPGRMAVGAIAAAIALCIGAPAFAQSNAEGSIDGDVVSASGPVGQAVVTIRNVDTGYTRSRASSEDGGYRFNALPTGTYEVSVTADGLDSLPVTVDVVVGESIPVELILFQAGQNLEEVVVQGQVQTIDTGVAETATIVTAADLQRLPVVRDLNAVALTAPGAVYGDTIWGNADKTRQHYGTGYGLASFGGSSVAENAYYINGMNVTNFRNGLGGSTLPFHFYDQFQIKTGGFGAEFGRSTGGVVNAITKRGGNDWEFGAGMYLSPDSLRSKSPDVADPTNPAEFDSVSSYDVQDEQETYAYVSGPLVKDRLFMYATYTTRANDEDNYTGGGELRVDRDDDPFWGLKLDWNISDNHVLEYTGFSDRRDTQRTVYGWDEATRITDAELGRSLISRGGTNNILKYTGHLTDDFTLSILGGTSEYDLTASADADEACPLIYDSRQGGLNRLGCWVNDLPETGRDEREVLRVDATWSIGQDHLLRFGLDSESNASENRNFYSGHSYYRYFAADPGDTLNSGGVVPPGVTEVARVRELEGGGRFNVESQGLYIEDEWYVTDAVTLRLGLRNERFDNRNAADETFIKITDQWAPRLGVSWDVNGEGTSKLYATLGRYHLPIASNTNIRLAGAEVFNETWYALSGINADGTPTLGAQIGAPIVFSDGEVPDVREVIDDTIEPMYQDEFVIGYERDLWDGYVGGVSFTYRDLQSTIEDVTIDAAVNLPGEFHYILTNPGTDVHTYYDIDGDGVLDELNLTAEQMGFPEAVRRYLALTFTLEKAFGDRLYLRGSYTWSHSYGNIEGYVRSDNGQDDAGLTTLYDFPGLMDGAYGDLPNDRRHQLKFLANYDLNDSWSINGSFAYQSGRPSNAFGVNPNDEFSALYGAESFYNQGVFTPRGSLGTGDEIFNIDLGASYSKDTVNGRFTARMDVFNIFDFDSVTEIDEIADEESGVAAATFGIPLYFQRPRSVRFGLQYDFGG